MSKGSKQRPKFISEEQIIENWDKIIASKEIQKHGRNLVHKDKTKVIPRKKKNDRDYE